MRARRAARRRSRLRRGVAVAGLTLDSRDSRAPATPSSRCRAAARHGLEYAAEAAARGARAMLWDPAEGRAPGAADAVVPFVAVRELRDRLGGIADRFYGMPSSRLTVAGVTGTNGKTTCAGCSPRPPGALARRGAYLGTLGSGFPPAVGRAAR